jgi:hypothetical protein
LQGPGEGYYWQDAEGCQYVSSHDEISLYADEPLQLGLGRIPVV